MSGLPATEAAVYQALSADSGVAALVGDRIFNPVAPAGAERPLVIFYVASAVYPHDSPIFHESNVIRVESVAESRQAAAALHNAAYVALEGKRLEVPGFYNWWTHNERKTVIAETWSGKQVYRYISDFRVRIGG